MRRNILVGGSISSYIVRGKLPSPTGCFSVGIELLGGKELFNGKGG